MTDWNCTYAGLSLLFFYPFFARRTKITDPVERFSVNASIKSATKANITLYVIDATEGITAQDKRLLDLLDTRKIPFILLINKTDLIAKKQKTLLSKSFTI